MGRACLVRITLYHIIIIEASSDINSTNLTCGFIYIYIMCMSVSVSVRVFRVPSLDNPLKYKVS